jgi:hypothetical protein
MILPNVEFEVQSMPTGMYRIQATKFHLNSRETKTEQIVKRAPRRAGLVDEKAVNKFWNLFAPSPTQCTERVALKSTVKTNLSGHRLGVLKIAYEMAWHWLGDTWLNDHMQSLCGLLSLGTTRSRARPRASLSKTPDPVLSATSIPDPLDANYKRPIFALPLERFRFGTLPTKTKDGGSIEISPPFTLVRESSPYKWYESGTAPRVHRNHWPQNGAGPRLEQKVGIQLNFAAGNTRLATRNYE